MQLTDLIDTFQSIAIIFLAFAVITSNRKPK